MKKISFFALIAVLTIGASTRPVSGRTADFKESKGQLTPRSAAPAVGMVGHRIGKIVLAVNNNGTIGTGFSQAGGIDWFTGQSVPSCEYPKGSNVSYLFAGSFWIGAVVGRDTLVSVSADGWSSAREFDPEVSPFGDIRKRSITFPDVPEAEGAVSEEDYVMIYTDTFTTGRDNDYFGRPHKPLNIEVSQNSYAWSYPYAEDFVLFDYQIKNIGFELLENVYMGFYVDADVGFLGGGAEVHTDDICGFIETFPSVFNGCDYLDTANIAYICDNDGDPLGSSFAATSPTGVTGMRIVRTPADQLDVSFNWWISNGSGALDFGPRERSFVGRFPEEFRDFRTSGVGTPEGDVNKYYIMRNREFDYDQIKTAIIQSTDTTWQFPPQDQAPGFADGFDTRYLLSFGPFDISEGEKLPISFAYVGGENVHRNPDNLDNLPDRPDLFYRNLDFTDFATNALWAGRVYDNPGIDTDGDGYLGKFRICCLDSVLVTDTIVNGTDTTYDTHYAGTGCDTLFYEGDGVPDFRGASPPPAPDFWLEPHEGAIKIRFNGFRSETTRDVFSRRVDFEGYRIYYARDDRPSSYSLAASFDRENYNKWVWNDFKVPTPDFELLEPPFSLDSLRCLYGDSCNDLSFNPETYSRSFPYVMPGYPESVFFFVPQDFNASELGLTTPIIKRFPGQPYPSTLVIDSAAAGELTDDGYFKYFEYEFELTDLLPTVPYWINITSFDYGSPESGLSALESSVSVGAKTAFASTSATEASAGNLEAYVYPNPYRLDARYRELGFEGRTDSDRPNDRVRRINFANLPAKCVIKIFTLDGDLVREISHDKDPLDPTASHEEWDLITRNTQLVASGLYYWTVESEGGETQIGKLAIIM